MTLSLLSRAAGQSLTGILANDPEQAVYLVNITDDHGAKSRAIVATSSSSKAATCPGRRVVVADDGRGRLQPDGQPGQPVLDRRPHPRRGQGHRWRQDPVHPGRSPENPQGVELPCPAQGTWLVIMGMYQPGTR